MREISKMQETLQEISKIKEALPKIQETLDEIPKIQETLKEIPKMQKMLRSRLLDPTNPIEPDSDDIHVHQSRVVSN